MPLQTLADDILLSNLRYASWEKNSRVDFKDQLALLCIFQRMRALALPIVYDQVYITLSKDINNKRQRYTNKYSKQFSKDIDTNADIIALTNCIHMAKSAILYVNGINIACDNLYNSVDALKSCAKSWPNITNLIISMSYDVDSVKPGKTRLTLFTNMGKKYGRELAKVMSGVTELSLFNDYSSGITYDANNNIVGAYAGQLVKLTSGFGFDHVGCHKFEAMQSLYINMGNYKKLPRVNSHTLIDLNIDHIPVNIWWAPFMDNESDTVVEFSCLKKLRLQFSFKEHIDKYLPELLLKFPELSSLSIKCDSDISTFFEMARFPSEMEVVSIQAPPELHAQIRDMQLPNAKKVLIFTYE